MSFSKPLSAVFIFVICLGFIGAGASAALNLGGIIKPFVQGQMSKALGVQVAIADLNISLQDKKASIHGLSIANPAGFQDGPAFSVGKVDITLKSVSMDLVVLDSVIAKDSTMNLEVNTNGTNLLAIQKILAKNGASSSRNAQNDPQGSQGKGGIKIIIDRLAMTGTRLKPTLTLKGVNIAEKAVSVPNIHLTDIGRGENGIVLRDAIVQIGTQVGNKLSDSAKRAGFYKGLSHEILKKVGAEEVEALNEKINRGFNELGNKLRSLF